MVTRIGRGRGHDRGRRGGNVEVLEEMRELRVRLKAIEKDRRRDPEAEDVSEPEDEEKKEEAAPLEEFWGLKWAS